MYCEILCRKHLKCEYICNIIVVLIADLVIKKNNKDDLYGIRKAETENFTKEIYG